MATYIDQMGHSIVIERIPQRIISIVPSQSEFLWDIGIGKRLVGITKFCIHPVKMFKSVTRVGGTKKLDLKKIKELKPDLIIGNKEENEQKDIEILKKDFPVWMSDIVTFEDAFQMMTELGEITGTQSSAEKIVMDLRQSISKLHNSFINKTVAYFIWKDPYMCAGKNTFIDHVLTHLGFINKVEAPRYPELPPMQLSSLRPEFCFLSSEPYPFKEKHIAELQQILPHSKIIIVDGEVFSWYGSRLKLLEPYLKELKVLLD